MASSSEPPLGPTLRQGGPAAVNEAYGGSSAQARDRLSSLQGLLALSMLMTESGDERHIVELAATSIPSLGPARLRGVHIDDEGWQEASGHAAPPADARAGLERSLAALAGAGGPVADFGEAWGWAFSLRGLDGPFGHVLVGAAVEPTSSEQFLLRVLMQLTSVALANARLHARHRLTERDQRTANAALSETVAVLEQRTAAHERLTRVAAAGEGLRGIARAVFELTGHAAAIEDRHGNLRAWAGPSEPNPYPKATAESRARGLRRARREGGPIRDDDRLIALAGRRGVIVGVIALIDPDATTSDEDRITLEHGATVLALELEREQSLAEMELRLRRDLVEELLLGTDEDSALARARALGYDLERPHRVVVVRGNRDPGGPGQLIHAVRRAARSMGIGSLMVARGGEVVLLADGDESWQAFAAAVDVESHELGCRVGVGEPCDSPAEVPRSYRQARLAMRVAVASSATPDVAVFADLGVYRVLAGLEETGEVDTFVGRWLGDLLAYDADRGGALVHTLSRYLECGGSYDGTAAALNVHRSTVKYRLKRIADVSGLNVTDPDTAFNLQLATRARETMAALNDER